MLLLLACTGKQNHSHLECRCPIYINQKSDRKIKTTNIENLSTHLQPDSMFMFPLHVVNMPRHSLHRIYGF